jgi:hypothetical protein
MKGRFWHFVKDFWSHNGSLDYSGEVFNFSGSFDAYLTQRHKKFKVSFPYKLHLYRFKNKYKLSVDLYFSHCQQANIAYGIEVVSKKEGIRQSLKIIKEFELNNEKTKELFLRVRHKEPIVSSDGKWIATCLIDSVEQCVSEFGDYGSVFYSLHKSDKEFWYWRKVTLHGGGLTSEGCQKMPLKIWFSIIGFDQTLDIDLNKALKFVSNNKLVVMNEGITGEEKAKNFFVFNKVFEKLSHFCIVFI